MTTRQASLIVLLAVLAAGPAKAADMPVTVREPDNSGWSLQLDNDLFSPRNHDRDYTGGVSLTFAGKRVTGWPLSLDPALDRLNDWLQRREPSSPLTLHSLQIGMLAFAPDDIGTTQLIADDRPYASLIYWANSRLILNTDGETADEQTLLLGILGTHIAENIQKTIHHVTGSTPPQGWQHQISDGGEPTFRYSLSRQRLLDQGLFGSHPWQLKRAIEGSLGMVTETNLALSLRWGRLRTPWWSNTPEWTEYFSQPTPGLTPAEWRGPPEFYLWAGVKARARLYNAFLQGQFQPSELRYHLDEMRPLIGEAWFGITRQTGDHSRLSWVLRYQGSELRHGHGDRDVMWGSFIYNRDY